MSHILGDAYYNDNDPGCAAWLRELIEAGELPRGAVDHRDIADIADADIVPFRQCHWFAGIGGWAYALRLAGWPESLQVWTGSCPCQPFSTAGSRRGRGDVRHLWPAWYRHILAQRPVVVLGEQVATSLDWLDGVFDDLERAGYTCGATDLCAAGIGAPHVRQRLFFVAYLTDKRLQVSEAQHGWREARGLGHTDGDRGRGNTRAVSAAEEGHERGMRNIADFTDDAGENGRLDDTRCHRLDEHPQRDGDPISGRELSPGADTVGSGHWHDVAWVPCRDGQYRPIKPGIEPLADGLPERVGLLRGYGNAIVPQVAQAFIESFLEEEIEQ
jgi:DNA (cytosine-5)-methyltransferase 1